MATPARSRHPTGDTARDARYENPFAPPDETDAPEAARPRSLFGEILD